MELVPPKAKRIIIAPLNWGLGHATRCIPIINQLIDHDKEVILASDGIALDLLRREFPQLQWTSLPSYNVSYRSDNLTQIIVSNSLRVTKAIYAEYFTCRSLVRKYQPDFIISDSRFGFRSTKVPSVILTHQLNPLAGNNPVGYLVKKMNNYYLNRFDECWIPDESNSLLSGSLSHNPKINNQSYIGILSRLTSKTVTSDYDLGLILSGPEPARSKLEKELITILGNQDLKVVLIRGAKVKTTVPAPQSWTVYDLATSELISDVIHRSKTIVSRSGYTSIMDYYKLNKGAILIPTPGQSEQEYLAKYLDGKLGFQAVTDMNELVTLLESRC